MKKNQNGFIELIIIIIIALLLMRYFGITVSGVIEWFKTFFANVLK
ncbi:MAG: hypothetical protein WAN61_02815 [Minisyncoccia bacterium]